MGGYVPIMIFCNILEKSLTLYWAQSTSWSPAEPCPKGLIAQSHGKEEEAGLESPCTEFWGWQQSRSSRQQWEWKLECRILRTEPASPGQGWTAGPLQPNPTGPETMHCLDNRWICMFALSLKSGCGPCQIPKNVSFCQQAFLLFYLDQTRVSDFHPDTGGHSGVTLELHQSYWDQSLAASEQNQK